jgi:hypothetical protein
MIFRNLRSLLSRGGRSTFKVQLIPKSVSGVPDVSIVPALRFAYAGSKVQSSIVRGRIRQELPRFRNSGNVKLRFSYWRVCFSMIAFSLFSPSRHWTLSVRRRPSMDSRRYSRPYPIFPCRRMKLSVSKFLLSWRPPGHRLWVIGRGI